MRFVSLFHFRFCPISRSIGAFRAHLRPENAGRVDGPGRRRGELGGRVNSGLGGEAQGCCRSLGGASELTSPRPTHALLPIYPDREEGGSNTNTAGSPWFAFKSGCVWMAPQHCGRCGWRFKSRFVRKACENGPLRHKAKRHGCHRCWRSNQGVIGRHTITAVAVVGVQVRVRSEGLLGWPQTPQGPPTPLSAPWLAFESGCVRNAHPNCCHHRGWSSR